MAIAPRPGTGPFPARPAAPVAPSAAPGVDLPIEQLAVTVETVDGRTRVFLGGSPEGLEGLAALCQELIKARQTGAWVECQRGDALVADSAADLVVFVAEATADP